MGIWISWFDEQTLVAWDQMITFRGSGKSFTMRYQGQIRYSPDLALQQGIASDIAGILDLTIEIELAVKLAIEKRPGFQFTESQRQACLPCRYAGVYWKQPIMAIHPA